MFPIGDTAPAMARSAATSLGDAIPPDRLPDIVLLISELVTNSVRHAGLGARDNVELQIDVDAEIVRVEVRDPGPGFIARLDDPDPARGSGWGLHLVDLLADRWGVEKSDTRAIAWFEIDL